MEETIHKGDVYQVSSAEHEDGMADDEPAVVVKMTVDELDKRVFLVMREERAKRFLASLAMSMRSAFFKEGAADAQAPIQAAQEDGL